MKSLRKTELEFFRENPGIAFDEGLYVVPKTSTGLAYQVERYEDTIAELRQIYPEHWAEIALDKEAIPLDPDYARYDRMAKEGILHLVTARDGPVLAGYHLSMITPHLHYKSSLTCFTDIFYLRKPYREGMNGYKLLKFFRDSVREKGVQKIYMGCKLALDLDSVLKRLGFTAIERLYTKVL